MKIIFFPLRKKRYIKPLTIIVLFIALAISLSSCSLGGKTNPSRFYMLDPIISTVTYSDLSNLSLGIGPFSFPGYVDRPQIVTKTENAEIIVAEYDRWAEPVDDMFLRTLSSNLKALTGSAYIASHPWPRQVKFDYQVKAKIINFENNTAGDALLIIHWAIYEPDDDAVMKSFHSKFTAKASNTSFPAKITALNETIAQLANEIIKEIN